MKPFTVAVLAALQLNAGVVKAQAFTAPAMTMPLPPGVTEEANPRYPLIKARATIARALNLGQDTTINKGLVDVNINNRVNGDLVVLVNSTGDKKK